MTRKGTRAMGVSERPTGVQTSACHSSNKLTSCTHSRCDRNTLASAPAERGHYWSALSAISPLTSIIILLQRTPLCALTARLAGFLSASLLRMLCGLTFHLALPKELGAPSFNPGIFKYFMVQSQGWGRQPRRGTITVVSRTPLAEPRWLPKCNDSQTDGARGNRRIKRTLDR